MRLFTCCCCSVTKSCTTLCDPMDYSMPGFPVLHYLPEFAQIHGHGVGDAISPSHSLLPSSPFAFHLPQHQGLLSLKKKKPEIPTRTLIFLLSLKLCPQIMGNILQLRSQEVPWEQPVYCQQHHFCSLG